MAVEWGSVAEWVSGVGTAGAFLIAAGAWRTQVRERHEAAEAARDEAARERSSQARQLTMWVEPNAQSSNNAGVINDVRLSILNSSGSAFQDVSAIVTVVHGPVSGQERVSLPVVPPTGEGVPLEKRVLVKVHARPGEADLFQLTVEAGFTDVHGVRWHRSATGELSEM